MPINYLPYRKVKPWVVTWLSPWTGRKLSKGFTAEADAEIFAAAQAELARKEKNIFKKAHTMKPSAQKITINELLDRYFLMAYVNKTTITQSRYHAAHIINAFGGRQASRLTNHDMLTFVEVQRQRGVAQITANRRLSILRAALNWAVRNGILPTNPIADLRLPHAAPRRHAPPTAKEANAIMGTASPHIQRIIVLGLYTGARIGPSKLFRLTWHDVDLANAVIRLPNAQKGHRDDGRDIPIRSCLTPILAAWMQSDATHGAKHVIHWCGRPVKCISKAWHQALKRAGINRRIRPYDLRHAYATYSLFGGADIKCVAELMGHADAGMILKTYQHVQDVQKRTAIESMPDLLNLSNLEKGQAKIPGLS